MEERQLEQFGRVIDKIDVKISYKIIELFSAGLYSSPNKAFEELICNSYDAFASKVSVYLPEDLTEENAYIFVADNGEGLNQEDMKDLWKIGESKKGTIPEKDGQRLQIGQFGIGKLSTYILAHKLTYISKKADRYLLVTTDYNRIQTSTEQLQLEEKELSLNEAQELINKYTIINGKNLIGFVMFGDKAEENWTVSLLTNLKPKATEIQIGRLKWILETALPLNPQFNLKLNGVPLVSSKVSIGISKQWIIGQNDRAAEDLSFANPIFDEKKKEYYVDFDSLKHVTGKFILYKESLLGGKSAQNGRSHGIFLSIRGRLVNLDDPLLGMPAFSHGPFNHCQILIEADDLNRYLTSTREAVKESKALAELKAYIQRKFNELRTYYFDQEEAKQKTKTIGYRLAQTSYSYSQKPIANFIEKFYNGDIVNPQLIKKPTCSKNDLLRTFTDEDGITQAITSIEWEIMDAHATIAKLDLQTKILHINALHPFVSNYCESYKSTVPLENIIIAEVLLETHMYEIGIDESQINSIIYKRDELLRQLAFSDKEGIPAVAQLLDESVANPTGLENAVYRALSVLGFETQKLGGNGKPDGFASANLGYDSLKCPRFYTLTYDAKSTQSKAIAAGTAKLSGIKRHQADYKATYSLEVAIDFEGSGKDDSAIAKEAREQKVTLMRVKDLAKLVLYSIPKQLSLTKLKDLFETCYTPEDVSKWIDDFIKTDVAKPPYNEIISIIYTLQKEDTEPPTVSVIRRELNAQLTSNYSSDKVTEFMKAIENIVPSQFHFDGEYAYVDSSPDILKGHISRAISSEIPLSAREIYNGIFSE